MLKRNVQYVYSAVIICLLVLISGCSNNDSFRKYNNAAKEFNRIYFETVQSSDSSDPYVFLKDMQTDKNKKNIEKLGLVSLTLTKCRLKK